MGISFVRGHPALLVEKEKLIVAGDLHIGLEFRFKENGLYFPNASVKMADDLIGICRDSNADGLVLLGDVKERVMNVTKEDEEALAGFFGRLKGIDIRIVKGNHDAYLDRILKRIGIDVMLENEVLLDDTALLHGNRMPSDEAMMKDYVITGHSHIAANVNGIDEKVWAVAKIGGGARASYEKFNRKSKLVMAPAFNDMIIGTRIGRNSKTNMPLVRKRVFDMDHADIYDMNGYRITQKAALLK